MRPLLLCALAVATVAVALARDAGMAREDFIGGMQSDFLLIKAFPPEWRWFAKDEALYTHLLEKKKIITRMVPENGINCNRVSTHIYNSPAEVDRVLEAIRELA